jgi:hypothetical protein
MIGFRDSKLTGAPPLLTWVVELNRCAVACLFSVFHRSSLSCIYWVALRRDAVAPRTNT